MVQRIEAGLRGEVDHKKLQRDLQRYLRLALQEGATAAGVVPVKRIVLDERVRLKCQVPLCKDHGTSANCPPHIGTVADMRARVEKYEFAVVFNVEFPSQRMVSGGGDPQENIADRQLIARIVSAVESAAFYDGHYMAAGFGAGSCKITWCPKVPCAVLQGAECRHPCRARASMEAVGMDVYGLAASLGWDIYPIGKSCEASQVPHGMRLGLILIA
jgi:predicted metal-binding protein